jgi:hypothetical protein
LQAKKDHKKYVILLKKAAEGGGLKKPWEAYKGDEIKF